MNVFACHLLNDYSGSPKVLMQLVKGWCKNNVHVTVVTCSGRTGFLSGLTASYSYYWYRWSAKPLVRLLNFLISQVSLFARIINLAKQGDVVYVNTVLPFGAAMAGRLRRCRVVYHVHETSVNPKLLKYFLFRVAKLCAHEVIFVSEFLNKQEDLKGISSQVLYNAIEESFYKLAQTNPLAQKRRSHVLMISSLKQYKGVSEFVALAGMNPHFSFRLVVNASQREIEMFFAGKTLTENLVIYPTQTDTHPFYRWADIVLNLSRPEAWVETFGLTVLEGMAYGLPAIVPPVGGITELVTEDVNGALVNCHDLDKVSQKLNSILLDQQIYTKMQQHALLKLNSFREEGFTKRSLAILGGPLRVIAR